MPSTRYEPTWRSLREHPTPQWFRDAKFGIYTHWGVYSVPEFGSSGAASNATWYPHRRYMDGSPHQRKAQLYQVHGRGRPLHLQG
jgi:alpha-L-fucosidase